MRQRNEGIFDGCVLWAVFAIRRQVDDSFSFMRHRSGRRSFGIAPQGEKYHALVQTVNETIYEPAGIHCLLRCNVKSEKRVHSRTNQELLLAP